MQRRALTPRGGHAESHRRTHETFKRAFTVWLKLHIVLSFTLYALLGLHAWAGIHFGLRWFS